MNTYNEQSQLSRYLWEHFPYLCTTQEIEVYKAWIGKLKSEAANHRGQAAFRKMFGDWERPDIAAELAEGFDIFTGRIVDRIGREHGELLYINRCNQCNKIAGTPRACMCQWCGHEWYDQREDQNQIANVAIENAKQAI